MGSWSRPPDLSGMPPVGQSGLSLGSEKHSSSPPSSPPQPRSHRHCFNSPKYYHLQFIYIFQDFPRLYIILSFPTFHCEELSPWAISEPPIISLYFPECLYLLQCSSVCLWFPVPIPVSVIPWSTPGVSMYLSFPVSAHVPAFAFVTYFDCDSRLLYICIPEVPILHISIS